MTFIWHGNNKEEPDLSKEVSNSFNSIGVWFSNEPEYARFFGKHLHKFKIPKAKWLVPKGPTVKNWDKLVSTIWDKQLAENLYTKQIAELLEKFYKSFPKVPSLSEEEWDWFDDELESSLQNLGHSFKSLRPENFFDHLILYNKDYLTLLKDKLEGQFDGILLKNSTIDGFRHDVYIIFSPEELGMKPETKVEGESKPKPEDKDLLKALEKVSK